MTDERDSRSSQPVPPILPKVPAATAQAESQAAVDSAPSVIRDFLSKRGSGSLADNSFAAVMLLCACSIFAIVLFIFGILVVHSRPSLAAFGWKFFTRQAWDPVSGDFGALPFIFGTLATSLLALCMAVPLALGVAVFLTELCPRPLARPYLFPYRTARRHSQRRLRPLGGLRSCADHARRPRPVPREDTRLDWTI